jgi:hypothetical protein
MEVSTYVVWCNRCKCAVSSAQCSPHKAAVACRLAASLCAPTLQHRRRTLLCHGTLPLILLPLLALAATESPHAAAPATAPGCCSPGCGVRAESLAEPVKQATPTKATEQCCCRQHCCGVLRVCFGVTH